jgi:inner membrane protein
MEPVTHFMTGACLARAGFNRKAAYATLAMTLAAEAPDLDTLWSVRGPVASLQHHRGITHTFLGLPFEALFVLAVIYLIHRYRQHRANTANPTSVLSSRSVAEGSASPASANAANPPPLLSSRDTALSSRSAAEGSASPRSATGASPLTAAPIRWPLLYAFILIALLSHILLDWTNNYGVRPFFPFNPRWYADSIVFIFEPVLFVALLIGLTAPSLFGLIAGEIGARRQPFRGRGWAIFALTAMVTLWGWRQIEHDAAIRLATTATYGPADSPVPPPVLRVTASPYPITPYRWHIVAETPTFYQLGTADTLDSTFDTHPGDDILYKPPTTLATLVAKRSWLGEVYLDWSSWPVVTDTGPASSLPAPLATPMPAPPGLTAVTFKDLRFMYDVSFLDGRRNPPLSGTVYVNADRRVVGMELGSTMQK